MGDQEIQNLRTALARRERGRGKRYTPTLKQRIAEAATQLRRQGQGGQAIGEFFGIPHETVRRFSSACATTALMPVEIVDEAGRREPDAGEPRGVPHRWARRRRRDRDHAATCDDHVAADDLCVGAWPTDGSAQGLPTASSGS